MAKTRDERDLLRDIPLYAHRAREIAGELDFSRERFEASLPCRYAIFWCIAVMGEAAGDISRDTRKLLPQVSWNEMIGMRNHLIHGYPFINHDIVWNVVINKLPPLIEALEPPNGETAVDPTDQPDPTDQLTK